MSAGPAPAGPWTRGEIHPHALLTIEPCGICAVGITCRCGHDLGTFPKTKDGGRAVLRAWLTHLRAERDACP